jgi:photosystem II stability/assembly factor-like uncharacterized protein
MKKLLSLLTIAIVAIAMAFVGCKKDDNNDGGGGGGTGGPSGTDKFSPPAWIQGTWSSAAKRAWDFTFTSDGITMNGMDLKDFFNQQYGDDECSVTFKEVTKTNNLYEIEIKIIGSTMGNLNLLYSFKKGNGNYIEIGFSTNGGPITYGRFDKADDGGGDTGALTAWTRCNLPEDFYATSLAFGKGMFVAGGSEGMIAVSSDDGKTWTVKKVHSSAESIKDVVFCGDQFVAVDYNCVVYYTSDPTSTWNNNQIYGYSLYNVHKIAYDGTTYAISLSNMWGESSTIIHTNDLGSENWLVATLPTEHIYFVDDFTYLGGYWFAVGAQNGGLKGAVSYATSITGPWTCLYSGSPWENTMQAIEYANNTFFVVGVDCAFTSNPGSAWTKMPQSSIIEHFAVKFGGGYWVAGGYGGIAHTDNISSKWHVTPKMSCENLEFGNNTFIAENNGNLYYATIKK